MAWFRKEDKQISLIKDSQGSLGNAYSEHVLQAGSSNPISWWSILPGKILHWLTIGANQRSWHSTLPIGVLFVETKWSYIMKY